MVGLANYTPVIASWSFWQTPYVEHLISRIPHEHLNHARRLIVTMTAL
jgi:hypothetical protein